MWFYIILWLLVGCAVSMGFFKVLDKMMKEHPDKNGSTSINDMIRHSVENNTEVANRNITSGIVKFAMVFVSIAVWPLFAIVLIWMATWA